MREHAHLAAMVRFVGKHVAQHFQADRPRWRPAISAKLLDAAASIAQRFSQHFHAARSALGQSCAGLLRRAIRALELSRHLQMWSGEPDPFTTHIVHMRENRHDWPDPVGRLRSPCRRVNLLDDHLIHALIRRENLRRCAAELRLNIPFSRRRRHSFLLQPVHDTSRPLLARKSLPSDATSFI